MKKFKINVLGCWMSHAHGCSEYPNSNRNCGKEELDPVLIFFKMQCTGMEEVNGSSDENEEEWHKTERSRRFSMKVVRHCFRNCHVERERDLVHIPNLSSLACDTIIKIYFYDEVFLALVLYFQNVFKGQMNFKKAKCQT